MRNPAKSSSPRRTLRSRTKKAAVKTTKAQSRRKQTKRTSPSPFFSLDSGRAVRNFTSGRKVSEEEGGDGPLLSPGVGSSGSPRVADEPPEGRTEVEEVEKENEEYDKVVKKDEDDHVEKLPVTPSSPLVRSHQRGEGSFPCWSLTTTTPSVVTDLKTVLSQIDLSGRVSPEKSSKIEKGRRCVLG